MKHVLPPLEFKDGGGAGDDDEVKQAVTTLTKTMTEAITKITADVKGIRDRQDEIEKKTNRSRLAGGGVVDDDGKGLAAECKALGSFVRTGDNSVFAEVKTNSIGSDPDGGYLVLPNISSTMTKRIYDLSPMRRLARVETIANGDAWEEPLDTDEVAGTWVGEQEDRPVGKTAQVGMLRVPLSEISANQPVTQRILDDSYINIGGWVTGKIGDKFARAEGIGFTTGNGIKQPRGLLSYPTSTATDLVRPWGTLQYIQSATGAAINGDDLKALMWAVRAVYRQGSCWLMNSNTAAAIDKLKNGDGDYIWRDGLTAGAQPSLLGYPVEFDESYPDIGAGNAPVAFGNVKLAYLIVDRVGIKMLHDPFTNKPNVLFYAYKRVGGGLAHSEAVKLLKT
ncbi:phage major capsid protein [Bradyrhizobium ontarionense]|uniref:Phage major capsid protein n=1 Tax=Bradyrhizobium ontarionense TaxID=2898149 RepID=A0ABY3R7A1_9BRAD|nr:phage major capsid protein [Bradyrhizobium sp. A19]UFZ02927.1 phage major capsid protein [Bradyrhizobium sp. A19]